MRLTLLDKRDTSFQVVTSHDPLCNHRRGRGSDSPSEDSLSCANPAFRSSRHIIPLPLPYHLRAIVGEFPASEIRFVRLSVGPAGGNTGSVREEHPRSYSRVITPSNDGLNCFRLSNRRRIRCHVTFLCVSCAKMRAWDACLLDSTLFSKDEAWKNSIGNGIL